MQALLTGLITMIVLLIPMAVHAQGMETHDDGATYTLSFTSSWREETHPGLPTNAHFSPLIGATHNLSATFWMSGTLASPGIEQMAETGATSLLRDEITAAGAHVHALLAWPGMAVSPGQITLPAFSADRNRPLVTVVTMIAPSPDWFVGVHDLSLLDEEGKWQETITVTLYPYDAGTDDGVTYTSPDDEPLQHQSITNLRGQTPFSSEPIGVFTFTRLHHLYLPTVTK